MTSHLTQEKNLTRKELTLYCPFSPNLSLWAWYFVLVVQFQRSISFHPSYQDFLTPNSLLDQVTIRKINLNLPLLVWLSP